MAKLTGGDYHIRGMTDVAGSPGVEIVTTAVEHHDDGSLRFTANGEQVVINHPVAMKLLAVVLGISRTPT